MGMEPELAFDEPNNASAASGRPPPTGDTTQQKQKRPYKRKGQPQVVTEPVIEEKAINETEGKGEGEEEDEEQEQ